MSSKEMGFYNPRSHLDSTVVTYKNPSPYYYMNEIKSNNIHFDGLIIQFNVGIVYFYKYSNQSLN